MPIRVALLDSDDALFTNEAAWIGAVDTAAKSFGYYHVAENWARIKTKSVPGMGYWIRHNSRCNVDPREFERRIHQAYREHGSLVKIREGFDYLVERLADNKILTGIFSNSTHSMIETNLLHTGIRTDFNFSSKTDTGHWKFKREAYEAAFQKVKLQIKGEELLTDECMFLDDNAGNIEKALDVELKAVYCPVSRSAKPIDHPGCITVYNAQDMKNFCDRYLPLVISQS